MNRTARWSSVVVGALCLVGSAALPAVAAPSAEGVPLKNLATGNCLNQVGDTDVELAKCSTGSEANRWQVVDAPNGTHQIKNVADSRCLGHAGKDDVKLYTCDASAAGQQWKLPSSGGGQQIQSVANDECLSHIQGAEVGLLACANTSAQQWNMQAGQSDEEDDLDF